MKGQLVDRRLMAMKYLSMQLDTLYDRNSKPKNLFGGLLNRIRWHTQECGVDIPRLTNVGCHWDVSERLGELFSRICGSTHDGRQTEIVIQGDEFHADLSHPAEPDNSET
jgi:hypothetical protein